MVEITSKLYIPPSRPERKSERLYRINEDIYSAQATLKECQLVGDWAGIKEQTRRIELLNASKNES